jgi:multiple sugar transport system substrate-binding protein
VLKTGAAAGAAAALSGCVGGISGGGGGSEGINIPEDPDGTVDGRTVTLAMDGGQNTLPARWSQDEIKSQTGVGLGEITGFPFSGLYDKLMTEFTSKSDAFDMVGFYPQMLGTFAANGHITPLDELMEIEGWDTAFDGVLKPFQQILTQWDGSTYALPFDGDVLMLVYRRDLFDKHDIKVPETWAEFNEAARYFSEETDDIEHGVATYGKRGFSYGWFLTRFGGAGGVYFDEDMNPQINTEAGRRALESWQETIQYAPDETSSYGYVGLRDAFLKGQCAMVIQWTDVPKKAATSEVKGKWGGAPVPGFSDAGAASAMPVSRVLGIPSYVSDEQKLAAFRFIQTLTSPDYSKHYVSDPACGQDPFHAAHFENPGIFTEPDPLRDADEAEETAFDSMESAEQYTNAVDQTLQQGYPEPYWPGAKQYINALDIEMSRFVAGQVGVEEALSNVESEWESIVEDLGRESQREAYQNVISAWQNAGLWN